MRPPTACRHCRERRRKCVKEENSRQCTFCAARHFDCTLEQPLIVSRWTDGYEALNQTGDEPCYPLPSLALCEELVDLYFRYVHDTFHSIFHKPTIIAELRTRRIPKIILYSMLALSTRFSHDATFSGIDMRDRGRPYARQAERILNLRNVSVTTIQAAILLGAFSITEAEAAAESVYYAIAGRMAALLNLPDAPVKGPVEKEVNIRIWWTLVMIDTWNSAGVSLPRFTNVRPDMRMPMEEFGFLQMDPDNVDDSVMADHLPSPTLHNSPNAKQGTSSESLMGHMIKLNRILIDINSVNELAASKNVDLIKLHQGVASASQQLDDWRSHLPWELLDTQENLERYASQGIGHIFVAVYLGYYNFGQQLYYQFLQQDIQDQPSLAHSYAQRCSANAGACCEILYRAYNTIGCEVLYSMVSHVLVIASTVQLHTLLFSGDDVQCQLAKRRLEKNYQILNGLRSYWPSVDVSFARFRLFHDTCRKSMDTSFRMDQWMLKFLLEFGKPLGERDMKSYAAQNATSSEGWIHL